MTKRTTHTCDRCGKVRERETLYTHWWRFTAPTLFISGGLHGPDRHFCNDCMWDFNHFMQNPTILRDPEDTGELGGMGRALAEQAKWRDEEE